MNVSIDQLLNIIGAKEVTIILLQQQLAELEKKLAENKT